MEAGNMWIRTWNRSLLITEKRHEEPNLAFYQGREIVDGKTVAYNVIQIKDGEIAKRFFSYMMEGEIGKRDMEFLITEDLVCFLFPYKKDRSLRERFQDEPFLLKERLMIGKNLLERIILLNLPTYLQWDVCNPDGILVSHTLTISFLYQLKDLVNFESYHAVDALKALKEVFHRLFKEEIKQKVSKAMLDFMDSFPVEEASKANNGDDGIYLLLYDKFQPAFQELWEMDGKGEFTPNTLPFHLWEKAKYVICKCKKAFAILLMAMVVLYTLLTVFIHKPKRKGGGEYRFSFIGSVEIEAKKE